MEKKKKKKLQSYRKFFPKIKEERLIKDLGKSLKKEKLFVGILFIYTVKLKTPLILMYLRPIKKNLAKEYTTV